MRKTVFTAVYVLLCLSIEAPALDGMVLQLNAAQFSRGALRLRYLSDGETVTLDGGSCFGPSFSPDGRKVAYSVNDSRIYVVDIDGANKREVTTCGGSEVMVTWAGNGYLYWSQCDRNIYRVKADGSGKGTVFTSSKNVHAVGVSQDGSRAAWTAPAWVLRVGDISTGNEREFGGGCQGSISPNGALVTHNQDGHKTCIIRNWDGSEYRRIGTPEGTFNAHRWSRSSNDYCLYTIESNRKAYVHNVRTDVATYVGATGAIYDFYTEEIRSDPSTPRMALSSSSIAFTAEPGGSATPSEAVVTVTNSTANTTLNTVTVSGAPAWLTVGVGGNGNSQTLTNTVNVAEAGGIGQYTATITVTAANADPQSVTYTVSLTVSGREPFSGSPIELPGRIQAEDYDKGGEGVAYHDVTASNQGGQYRTNEAVDVETCTDDGGGYNVGYIEDGEWLEYTVEVSTQGTFDFALRVAAQSAGGPFRVLLDGTDISGDIAVASTGSWSTWATVEVPGLSLPSGEHILRVSAVSGGFNLNYIDVTAAAVVPDIAVSEPAAGAAYRVGEQLAVSYSAQCAVVPGVKMELSLDDGENFVVIEASGSLDCGEQTWLWTIPDSVSNGSTGKRSTVSNTCRVRVSNYMGAQQELSGLFAIQASQAVRAERLSPLAGTRPVTCRALGHGQLVVDAAVRGSYRVSVVTLDGHVAGTIDGNVPRVHTIEGLSSGTYVVTVARQHGTPTMQSIAVP